MKKGCLIAFVLFSTFIGWQCVSCNRYIAPKHLPEFVGTWVSEDRSKPGDDYPFESRDKYQFNADGSGLKTHYFKGYTRKKFRYANEHYTQRIQWVVTGVRLRIKYLEDPFKDIESSWIWKFNEDKTVLTLSDYEGSENNWSITRIK